LGGRGFASIVDLGSVLLALTPKGDLTVFEPSDKEFKKLATYKVTETETYAYPVPSAKGLFVKDKDGISFWTTD
jgi:outer membrane protein assembly factor BamB